MAAHHAGIQIVPRGTWQIDGRTGTRMIHFHRSKITAAMASRREITLQEYPNE
jgi:hypothetical protein